MSYNSTEEPFGTTSSEDGEQEPCETTTPWEFVLVFVYSYFGAITTFCYILLIYRRFYRYSARLRGRRWASWLWRLSANIVLCGVVFALWPIFMLTLFCPCLWEIPAAEINGGQDNGATDTSRTANSHWHRRGWLVLLRARHQRIAAPPGRSKGRWTGCCRKQNGLPMPVVPPPREKDGIEGGQGSVAKDIAASGFRTLVMRVVEHEEDGVFRSIVGYL